MKDLEEKYIELLLKRCINFNKSKSLFINYDKVNKKFVDRLAIQAKNMGVEDICFDEEDINLTHDKLKTSSIETIEKDPYFNKSKWDEYAKKNASFLILITEFPHFMDDIDPELISKSAYVSRTTRPLYKKLQLSYEIPWCIAALPNEYWAKDLFGDKEASYDKLFNLIMKICMIDTENPIKSWEKYIEIAKEQADKLNSLEIKKLHYTNNLGTDLYLYMPEEYIFSSASSDYKKGMLVNMPSYEIFASPDYRKTEGIVYSSRPLVYNGALIDKFYLEFKDGKVVNYDAEVGKEVLKGIIESDSNSCYLGEVALVNNDSPISNTGVVFGTTLIDENASCHLALGEGFNNSIKGGEKLSEHQLLEKGINQSKQHVDFMIGTSDLKIEAETKNEKIIIFKNGNFT